jgi:hypothetical protein
LAAILLAMVWISLARSAGVGSQGSTCGLSAREGPALADKPPVAPVSSPVAPVLPGGFSGRDVVLPLLGAMAFLVHPEAVLVYPLYALLSLLWGEGLRRKVVAGTTILGVLVGAATCARICYFHSMVPNTFFSKPSNWSVAVQNAYGLLMGLNSNVAFPITGWLAVPLLLLGYRRLRHTVPSAADMLAAIVGTGLGFAVYSSADWTSLPRYFAPYLPAALLLLWIGLTEATVLLLPATERSRRLVLCGIAMVLILANIVNDRTKMAQMEDFPGYVLSGKSLIEPARWIRDHVPAEATVATRRIGALAYYSGRKVLDYSYGLPDAEIARLVARQGRRFDTPTDAALAAVWRVRAPDYILEDGPIIDYIASKAGGSRARFSVHGIEYGVIRRFPIGNDAEWVLAGRRYTSNKLGGKGSQRRISP